MKKILLLLSLVVAALTSPAQVADNLPLDKFGYTKAAEWHSDYTGANYLLYGAYDDSEGVRVCIEYARNAQNGVVADGGDLTLQKMVFTWAASLWGDMTGVTIEAFGSDTPYTSVEQLFDEATSGQKIGEITYPATELVATGSYSYVGFRMAKEYSGAFIGAELGSIDFCWNSDKEEMSPITVTDADGVALGDGCKYAVTGTSTYAITSATPDVTFSWTMGNQSGTGVGTTYVTVTDPGELKITAEKDGYLTRERTIEFAEGQVIKSISEAWQVYPMPSAGNQNFGVAFPVDFEATVVYAANIPGAAIIIIYDGADYSRIYAPDTTVDFAPGDVLARGWYATFGRMTAWKQFVAQSPLTAISHDGEVPAPKTVGDTEALEALEPGTPVVVRGVTLPVPSNPEIYVLDEATKQIKTDNSPVALINAFGTPSVPAGKYDIYGIVDFYGYKRSNAPAVGPTDGDFSHRRWRVAVTEFEVWKPTSPRPAFALANDSEVDSGEPIVITCQDEAATIMYSMDGGEYAEYDAANPPLMPAADVTVSAYSRQEGYHDSAVRTVSLRYSGKAGIADITLDEGVAAEYYDLTGRRVINPAAGMYIRVRGGKSTKVTIK